MIRETFDPFPLYFSINHKKKLAWKNYGEKPLILGIRSVVIEVRLNYPILAWNTLEPAYSRQSFAMHCPPVATRNKISIVRLRFHDTPPKIIDKLTLWLTAKTRAAIIVISPCCTAVKFCKIPDTYSAGAQVHNTEMHLTFRTIQGKKLR